MERSFAGNGSKEEAWFGGVVLHTEKLADTPSPIQPEQVFPVIDETVQQHGRMIGREVFKSIFPKMEHLFDSRYREEPTDSVIEAA